MDRGTLLQRPARGTPEIEFFHRWDPGADLQVLYAGFQACLPSHGWKGRRNHALFHYVFRGQGRVRIGRRQWRLGTGDSFLFYPQSDLWYEADRADPWSYAWVGLGGTRVTTWLDLCGFRRDEPVLAPTEGRHPGPLVLDILEALGSGPSGPPASLRVQSRLFALLEALAVPCEPSPGPPADDVRAVPYVQAIMKFLEQAYSRPLTTQTIAQFAGLERTYCSHLFSTTTGQPLMQYLAALRMDKALELLRGTDMSIRAVAESVGYPDAGVFAKRFRAIKGVSPSQVRLGSG